MKHWRASVGPMCGRCFDSHGNPLEITELGENEAAAIAAFEFCEDFAGKDDERRACGYTRRFKMADKLKAFELYGKAMGYYAERQELTGKASSPLVLTVNFVDPEYAPLVSDGLSNASSVVSL